ncbi:FAD-dependent oxidoreductase [Labrys miyagiensis]|uniref:FAD-dependent oxidoreductase n=2 Tax=Labrys miyagiensis TaxID=346912 RepID=A0ABQ6CLY7_9HYPH|nr:FAD-dependent oxidoreductase [Labrys miyagiensis]
MVAATPLADLEAPHVTVVGGGILGLSCALHLARAGRSVRVLEAARIGAGASGLNGGQVIPGLKYDPDQLLQHYGEKRGEQVIDFAASTADRVFDLIAAEKLDIPWQRKGWIQAAHTEKAAELAWRRAKTWTGRGVAARALSRDDVATLTGAEGYVGGWLDPRAGVIDPLAYTLGLAKLAAQAGVLIAEDARALQLRRDGALWRIRTSTGVELRSSHVIVATNAYADGLVPGLARTLLPLHSFQIATFPLEPSALARILPGGQAVSDSRRILVYYRKSPDGRLMLGGRGSMAEPSQPRAWAHLEHALVRLFPGLRGLAIEKRWFGRVAMTLDHLPHLHQPEPGLTIAAGCQGRGVGLMTALGPRLADYVLSGDPRTLPFDLTPIRPIPLHRFRHIGMGAAIAWYRFLDALDR